MKVGIIKCQLELINEHMKNGGTDPILRSISLEGQTLGE